MVAEGTDTWDWLQRLTLDEIDDLLYASNKALKEAERLMGTRLEEAGLSTPDDLSALRAEHAQAVEELVNALEAGKITREEFEVGMQDLITTNFRAAYEMQLNGREMTDGDEEWLRRAVQQELKYARRFASDAEDDTGVMDYSDRAKLWGQSLDGIAWHSWVESLPEDVQLDWVLGNCEHCISCEVLAANSPYSKYDLPCTPRSGATECLSRCHCKIIVKKGKLSPDEMADVGEYEYRKDQSLADLTKIPSPPKGMRHADENEQRYVDALRNRINFLRQQVADESLSDDEREQAAKERSAVNGELIDFTEKNDIYEVPVFGVDDVLDGRHIGRRAVQDIFRHGIDGRSLDKVEANRLDALLSRYEDVVGETLSDDVLAQQLGEE